MSFEKAHISHDYIYNHDTKDISELRKLSTTPKATFYRNLKETQQGTTKRRHGSGRPRVLNEKDEKSMTMTM